jgi:hypothetical protein
VLQGGGLERGREMPAADGLGLVDVLQGGGGIRSWKEKGGARRQ